MVAMAMTGSAQDGGEFPRMAAQNHDASRAYVARLRDDYQLALGAGVATIGEDMRVDGGPPVRVYGVAPENGSSRPCVVYAHGGGWVMGDLDMHDRLCAELARRADCVVVSVDYRLAPEHPHPAPVSDVARAYRWAHAHADRLGIDRSRMTLMGSSSGGTLALNAIGDLTDMRPALLVLVYPPIDPSLTTASADEFAIGHVLEREQMRWFWTQYAPGPLSEDPGAVPALRADVGGLPATLMITAENDVLRDDAEQFAQRLAAENRLVDLVRYADEEHGFFALVGSSTSADEAIEEVAVHVRRVSSGDAS